ncbi:hypothetical protein HYH03_012760 [Edaphochlamys debaryana]|uniref:Uncharacterized protein n=1 Tax=Edaphochlamys debaryana TaxID=47281 RepID=A0A835XPL2_9CHLO|nr:hypothetical protein HYH03_012760 [Edaphochlamys debaryana]|eukprot:KAG2488762.1 hypothetical protein HYH03_012760 [Edaphochlamys debaryana]
MAAAQPQINGEAAAKAVLRGATRIVLACTTLGAAAQPTAGEVQDLSQQMRDCPEPDLFRLLDRPASSCQMVKLLACSLRAADTTSADVSSSYLELAHALLDRLRSWQAQPNGDPPNTAQGRSVWLASINQRLQHNQLLTLAVLRSGNLQACCRLLARAETQGLDVAAVARVANSLVSFVSGSPAVLAEETSGTVTEELAVVMGASGLLHHASYLLHKLGTAAANEVPPGGVLAEGLQHTTTFAACAVGFLGLLPFSMRAQSAMYSPWLSYGTTAAVLLTLASLDGGPTYGLPAAAEPGARALITVDGRSLALRAWALANLNGTGAATACGSGGGGEGPCGSGGSDSSGGSGSRQAAAGLCFVPDAALFRIGLRVAAASAALVEPAGPLPQELKKNALVAAAAGAVVVADGALSRLLAAAERGGTPGVAAADRKLAAWWRAAVSAAGAVASTAHEWAKARAAAHAWYVMIGTAPEVAGCLATCMVQRLSPSTEEQGTLPPSPPPGLAVALSAGALPALERLLRRTDGALLLTDPRAGLGPSASDQPAAALLSWPRLGAVLAYGDVRQAASLVATVGKLLAARVAQCDRTAGARDEQVDALVRLSLEAAVAGRAWAAERCRAVVEAEAPGEAAGSSSPRPAPSSPPSAADAQLLRLVAWMHARWLPAWAAWGSGVARRLAAAPEEVREVLVRDVHAVLEASSYPLDCLPFSLTEGAQTIRQLARATGAAAAAPAAPDLAGDPYATVARFAGQASTLQGTAEDAVAAAQAALATAEGVMEARTSLAIRSAQSTWTQTEEYKARKLVLATMEANNVCQLEINAIEEEEAVNVYCRSAFAVVSRGRPSAEEAAAEAQSVAAWGQVLLGGTATVMTFLSDVAATGRMSSSDDMHDAEVRLMRHRLRQLLVHFTEPTCSYLSSLAGGDVEGGAAGSSHTPPPRRLQPFLDVFRCRGPQPDPALEDLLLELRRGPVGAARPSGPVELPPIWAPTLLGTLVAPSLLWPPPLQLCGNGRCGCLEGDSEAVREAALAPCSRGCGVAWFCCAECERVALGEGHGGVCGGGGAGRGGG